MTKKEKILHDKLYHYEASYPADMWDRISAELPKKEKSRKLWLLLFIGLAAISSLIITQPHQVHNNALTTLSPNPVNQEKGSFQESLGKSPLLMNEISENSNSEITSQKINRTPAKKVLVSSEKNIGQSRNSNNTLDLNNPANEIEVQIPDDNKKIDVTKKVNRTLLFPKIGSVERFALGHNLDISAPECPTFGGETGGGLYFDLYYSHDYGLRKLKAKSTEYTQYASDRENSENAQYSFSAGFRIAFISSSGYGIKSGLNFSQINEKFEYLDPDASLIRTIITIDTVFVNGLPTVITDTSTYRIPGALDITTYNRYKFFDIPILATYEGNLTDKLYYNINGGVLLNLSFSQKGRFLSPTDQPVWFSSGRAGKYDAFKMSAGISLYGSFGLYYRWNDHLDFTLEPNIRIYSSSLTLNEYPLEQNYVITGLITGIRYKF